MSLFNEVVASLRKMHSCIIFMNWTVLILMIILTCFSAMAVALGNLYHDDLDVNVEDVAGVMAASSVLGFKNLIDR